MFKIVDGPIDELALESAVRTDADGAVIVFRGVARRHSRGRDVVHLEYEAYPEMAEKVMSQIGDEMKGRWPISRVAIVHRTGVLEIGQASVGDAVPETMVVVRMDADGSDGTVLELEHYGFGVGPDWDPLYVGAARAWAAYLKNLRAVLEAGVDLREPDE